jgi:hypothetical protein
MKSFIDYIKEQISSRKALRVHFDIPEEKIPKDEEEARKMLTKLEDEHHAAKGHMPTDKS